VRGKKNPQRKVARLYSAREKHNRNFSFSLPRLRYAFRILHPRPFAMALRALSEMLAHGPQHLVGTLLSSAVAHASYAQAGRDAVPLRVLPLQFCQLSRLQGEVFLEKSGALGKGRVGQAIGVCGLSSLLLRNNKNGSK
jgi:hypothetical protein